MAPDRKCPKCSKNLGVIVGIGTILGRRGVLSISLYCDSCHHKWTVEDPPETPAGPAKPQE